MHRRQTLYAAIYRILRLSEDMTGQQGRRTERRSRRFLVTRSTPGSWPVKPLVQSVVPAQTTVSLWVKMLMTA